MGPVAKAMEKSRVATQALMRMKALRWPSVPCENARVAIPRMRVVRISHRLTAVAERKVFRVRIFSVPVRKKEDRANASDIGAC